MHGHGEVCCRSRRSGGAGGWVPLSVRRRSGARLLVVLALGAVAMPVSAQDSRWVGCYEVDRGAWTWTRADEDSTQFEVPAVIRLSAETTDSPRTINPWLVEPAVVSYRLAPGSWAPLGEDSVSIVWSTGFTGPSMRVGVSGDSLLGTVTAFSDNRIGVPDPSASVVLRPRTCENRGAQAGGG